MATFTKKIIIMLQIAISLLTGTIASLLSILMRASNVLLIFAVSSIACFLSIVFTIWNIKKTFSKSLHNIDF